ncbi:hypothetical protein M3Y94_01056200 [Aphelenchoides besseyi]|nr:hypothetical protein M3Y94_01056200 [Aphelenchoides besseyi]KAI6224141.1 hypothetical protein M3Y95_00851800 [Aphelenchoides besseyi]
MGSGQSSEVDANSVPLNEVLNENGRSLKWLKEQLEKKDSKFGELAKTHEIEEAKCNRIGVGKGYCSHVYRVNFKFKPEDSVHSIVMKIPTIAPMVAVYEGREISDEKRAKMTKTVVDLHNIECEAYEHLKDLKSIGFPIPAVYATEKCVDGQMGILAMEDMSVGTLSMDVFKSVTVEQSLNFARYIADFQAFVANLPADTLQNNFSSCYYVDRFVGGNAVVVDESPQKAFAKLVDFRPEEQSGLIKEYMKLNLYEFSKYTLQDIAKEYNATTWCHGDIWSNNVLISCNRPDEIAAFLDWAIMFQGSPLFDIACFLCWCADEEVRKKMETQLLDVYYERLTENLRRVDRQVPFSRAQAQELYELSFLHTNTTFCEMVAAAAFPLSQSDKKEDLERFEVLWKRLLSAMDVMHLMEKYKIVEKFGRQNVEETI